ncbi:hypothetical protein JJC03_15660 [Flavobacterium oreochromis]|uniref:hypothetical protein n=1 Tax=Flavobacterium oreochromis TaxID=2906078 RepID=UPI001CE61056|nr:hypothetical protein [Flavobacterium oreochromis]QYS86336.1 hypothetical protein JJC03_15660 [Flavobacterium oreochromis]
MPFEYSHNVVAVEIEELVPRFWSKSKSLYQELWRYKEKPYGIKRIENAFLNGIPLINFDSLKPEYQEALGDPRKVNHPLDLFFQFDAEAVRYYAAFKRNGSALKSDEQERYIINASVMQAVIKLEQKRIEERIRMRGSLRGIMETLIYDVESFQHTLKVKYKTEHTLPTSKRFKDALKDFKENSYYSLIKDPNGTGKQNARKVDERVEMIFNALFKNQIHKPTPTEVARNYEAFLNGYAQVFNEDTGELYNPKEFKKLSQATIINYINKWENRIATHHERSGDRQKFMGKYKPHHQLDLPTLAGELISIDDRQPPFVYNQNGDRMWFYLGLDVASRCFTTFVYGKTKEGLILEFYRQMVRNYTEWGFCLPYELECESSLNSSFKNNLLRPGAMFDAVRIEANNARGKYIERAFGTLRNNVEKQNLGWLARPHAKAEANQKRTDKKLIIPYDTLVNERLLDIEMSNNMPHPENKELTRWEYFQANQAPNLKPTNWAAILPVLGHKTPTSCHLGYVNLQGRKRAIAENGKILTGEALIQQMKIIEGKDVDVYWLDANDGSVLKALVYYKDRLICEIMEMPRYNRASMNRTEADKEAQLLQSAYVASVEAFAKRKRNNIENINIIDSTPKTLNNGFRIPNLKRFELNEEPAEVFDDELQEEYAYNTNQRPTEWRSNFNL